MRYRIFGFTDESPNNEVLLDSFDDINTAIGYAESYDMATIIIDSKTDETVWDAYADFDEDDFPERTQSKERRLGTKTDLAKFHIQARNGAKKRT